MASIDLYNKDISAYEMNQYLLQLKVLRTYMDRSESLSIAEVDFLKNNFRQLIGLVPVRVHHIDSFSQPFERLVINEDVSDANKRLINLGQLRYPPLAISDEIDYNRASLKGKCILYAGSMGMLPTTIEVKPRRGQLITSSKWTFNKKRSLKMIVIGMDPELAMSNPNELLDDFNEYRKCLQQMQPNCRTVVTEVSSFIVSAFTRKVSPSNRQGYIMSALISEFFYENPDEPVDAMYYPSVPNNGSAMNIAIKPEVVDELFDMVEAQESIVAVDPGLGAGGWLTHATGECKYFDAKTLSLSWNNGHISEDTKELMKKFNASLD